MSQLRILSWFVVYWLFVGANVAWPALRQVAGGSAKIARWAVVSDAQAKASGIADLLTAELTQRGLELVERDELAKVIDEQTIGLLAKGNVKERLRIGELLHADGLIVLRQTADPQRPGQQQYNVVLCECRQGARLGAYSYGAARLPKAAEDIAQVVVDRATQFAGGLQRIVAVAPFACLNIEHDYDTQARSFFNVVTNQLLTLDGVAVLEVEEARQLAKELSGGSGASTRRIPLFLLPTFKVSFRGLARFDLNIEVESGSGITKLSAQDKSLNEALSWLHDQLIEDVKRGLGTNQTDLTPTQQQQRLNERADLFERLGDLPRAIECREAYLLADSQNVPQRLAILRHLKPLGFEIPSAPRLKTESGRQSMFASMMNAERGLEHLGFLIRSGLISRSKALQELKTMDVLVTGAMPRLAIAYVNADETARTYWDASMAAKRQFVLNAASKIRYLTDGQPRNELDLASQDFRVEMFIMALVGNDLSAHACDTNSFEYFLQAVRELYPESSATSAMVFDLLKQNFQQYYLPNADGSYPIPSQRKRMIGPDSTTVKRYVSRMKSAGHRHLRWYAMLWEIKESTDPYLNWLAYKTGDMPPRPDTTELNALIRELETNAAQRGTNGASNDAVLASALHMKKLIEEVGSVPSIPKPDVPARPSAPAEPPRKRYLDNNWNEIKIGRLQIKRIGSPTNEGSIASDGKDKTDCWDGQHNWRCAVNADVMIENAQGQIVQRITRDQGLPPHDTDIRLYSLEKNKVLAFGKHGKEQGCWLAVLSLQKEGPSVNVVHEARRRLGNGSIEVETKRQVDGQSDYSFTPSWMCHVKDKIYLGRQGFTPLLIDLRTGNVTVSEDFGSAIGPGEVFSDLPHVFKAHHRGVAHLVLPANGNSLRMVDEKMISAGIPPLWHDQYPTLLEQGDWIVKPGIVWYRFRKDGTQLEQLVSEPLPNNFHNLRYWRTESGRIRSADYEFEIE